MSFLDSVPVIGSIRKSNRANEIVESAERHMRRAQSRLEDAREESQKCMEDLLATKMQCATDIIPAAMDVLEKCQAINRKDTKVAQDAFLQFEQHSAPMLRETSVRITEVVSTGLMGGSTGASLALGSMSMVSAFGTASTGTAIATLSGAAAQNATLAWFGGGALSAGGAGVAGGAMVLGGIALAPLAIFGAFKYAAHAEKKLTAAQEYSNDVDIKVEQIDAVIKVVKELNKHVRLYASILEGIAERLASSANALDEAIGHGHDEKRILLLKTQTLLLIKAAKQLLEIELFDSQQNPTQKSLLIIEHARHMTDSNASVFVEQVVENKQIEAPARLDELVPGEDSAKYFWFSDFVKKVSAAGGGGKFFGLLFWLIVFAIAYYVYTMIFDDESVEHVESATVGLPASGAEYVDDSPDEANEPEPQAVMADSSSSEAQPQEAISAVPVDLIMLDHQERGFSRCPEESNVIFSCQTIKSQQIDVCEMKDGIQYLSGDIGKELQMSLLFNRDNMLIAGALPAGFKMQLADSSGFNFFISVGYANDDNHTQEAEVYSRLTEYSKTALNECETNKIITHVNSGDLPLELSPLTPWSGVAAQKGADVVTEQAHVMPDPNVGGHLVDTRCPNRASVLFSCETTRGKHVDVCDGQSTVDYYFGKMGQEPELQLTLSKSEVTVTSNLENGYFMDIRNSNTMYQIFYSPVSSGEAFVEAGINVTMNSKLLTTVNCVPDKVFSNVTYRRL